MVLGSRESVRRLVPVTGPDGSRLLRLSFVLSEGTGGTTFVDLFRVKASGAPFD